MTLYEYYMVFPDGQEQEIFQTIAVGKFIDINGNPLPDRLPTNKMIVYQVVSKRTIENRGIVRILYILEQLNANELLDFI